MITSAVSPSSSVQQDVIAWIDNYSNRFGDFSPNSKVIFLAVTHKKQLYEDYRADMNNLHENFVNETIVLEIWRTSLPYVCLRPRCCVTGKCDTCYKIDTIRQNHSRNTAMMQAAAQAHLLHRGGMFQLEKGAYRARRRFAQEDLNTRMSIIIDGMDSKHTKCPYLGSQDSFSRPLEAHVQGVLQHGDGKSTYFLRYISNI